MSEDKIKRALDNTKRELTNWFSNTSFAKEKSYAVKHAEWTEEKAMKNKFIRQNRGTSKGDEVQRKRKLVYWTELGMNVGNELCEDHFCVVIKEFEKTAVVIPISSKKDSDDPYKTEDNGYFEIGCIEDLPGDKRDSYAVISQIRTVSKKRLSSYPDPTKQKKYLRMKLNDTQMDIIDKAVKKLYTNS